MDPSLLDSTFMLRLFESLMWLLAWLATAVFVTEVLCVVILVLGGRLKQREVIKRT
jgi:hypothetical protein